MKQPKKPTLVQKKIMSANNLKWANWMVVDETEEILTIYNKISKKTRSIKK